MRGLGLRQLSRDIGFTFARQVLVLVLNLLAVVLIARIYGPEGNGVLAVVLLLPSILSSLLNIGVAPANVYFLGSNQISLVEIIRANGRIFVVVGVLGLIAGGGLLLWDASLIFPGISPVLLWIALAVFPIGLMNSYLASIFQGLQRFGPFNKIAILQPLMLLIVVASLALAEIHEIALLVAAQLVSQIIVTGMTLLLLMPFLRDKNSCERQLRGGVERKLISYGWKAHLSNVLTFVNYKADVYIVNLFIGPAAVGVYVISVAIAEKLWLISQAVSTVLLPRLSQLSSDEVKRKVLTPLIARWVLLTTFLSAIAAGIASELFIRLVFGSAYSAAFAPLLVLLPGIVLLSATRVLANDIAARGRPDINMLTSALAVVINIAGNLTLIPVHGLLGAALSTSLAYCLMFVVTLIIYGKLSGNRWAEPLFIRLDDLKSIRSMMKPAQC